MGQDQQFADFVVEYDFTNTPEMSGEFQLLPPGEYVFDITFLEQKPSSSNNPMVSVTFVVADAEAQDNDEARAFAGQRAWGTYSLLPQSYGRLKKLMVACNANLTRFVASEILNSRIRGTIVHRTGEARPDQDGNLQPAKVFANIINERPLDDGGEQQAAPATPPPVLNKAKAANGAAKPQGGAQRRA